MSEGTQVGHPVQKALHMLILFSPCLIIPDREGAEQRSYAASFLLWKILSGVQSQDLKQRSPEVTRKRSQELHKLGQL